MANEIKEVSRSATEDEKGVINYTHNYIFTSDDLDLTQDDVGDYLPNMWSSHPTNPICFLKNASATQRNGEPGTWDISLVYNNAPVDVGSAASGGGSPSGDPGQGAQGVQPDLRTPTVTIDSVEVEKILTEDYSVPAKLIRNSALIPFDPPLTVTSYRPQITITLFKAIAADSYANAANYVGKVNSDLFLGFAAETVLCKKYSLAGQWEQGAWYWSKTVVFEIKDDGWNPVKILDAGTVERYSTATPQYRPILDAEGNPVTTPVPLNGSGRKLAPGDDPVYLEYTAYQKVAFAGIL